MELPKKYKHKEAEAKWQKFWKNSKIYKWEEELSRDKTFVIDTPPPTVSGLLHMGHIFSYTQADFIARFQRMSGKTVFYPMGFDDNGLPTERLVEKVKKIRGVNMEREEFVENCQEVVEQAEIEFENLFNSIALSVDWDEKYQTISKEVQKISQMSFLDLYKKGRVERKLEPVFWDCVDRTALAQADLEDKELLSSMNDIEFKIKDSDQKITIATTRPELLPACVAVMVHPDDERYKNLVGKTAITALFNREVKIIADDLVKIDKGTGAVMCCTFGDETDILWWRKHRLDNIEIRLENGRIISREDKYLLDDQDLFLKNSRLLIVLPDGLKNSNFFKEIFGLKIKEARKKIIEILEEKGLLVKSENIMHMVKCGERSGTPVEIILKEQWFIKITHIKEELKKQASKCNWHPHFMKIRVEQWIDNLSWDWCISRQRFFGVPIPIYYLVKENSEDMEEIIMYPDKDNKEEIKEYMNNLPIDPISKDFCPKGYSIVDLMYDTNNKYKGKILRKNDTGDQYRFTPETDIMDTWATSSLTPQLSSKGINSELTLAGGKEGQNRHKKLFPADLRPQSHEIIRSWAFYTIVKAYLHEETIPWHNLMISGWCLAKDKTKMSKSKGNVITPNSLIEEKGSDVVRYWASTSHLGTDIVYSEDVLKIGNKLLNKLFNASKFVSSNFDLLEVRPTTVKEDVTNGLIDQDMDLWILSRLYVVIEKSTKEFDKFEYAKAREAIEDFFWNDFCDNYLEIIKIRSYGIKADKYRDIEILELDKKKILKQQQSAIITLYYCLVNIFKLFAPFIPHITEELYSIIFKDDFEANKSIHRRGQWPKIKDHILNDEIIKMGNNVLRIVAEIRKFKSDNNLSMKTKLKNFTININLDNILDDLKNVCNCEEIMVEEKMDKIVSKVNL